MGFWCFLLVCNLLLPILMTVAGRRMWKNCPKDINKVYGYRTNRSMKNQDTWKFAHEYCGKLWWKVGIIMTVVTVLVHIPLLFISSNIIKIVGLIPTMLQCIIMIVTIVMTEKQLEKEFNEDGTRK